MKAVGRWLLRSYYGLFCLLSLLSLLFFLERDSLLSLLFVYEGVAGALLAASGVAGACAVVIGAALSASDKARSIMSGGALIALGGVLGSTGFSPFLCIGGCSGVGSVGLVVASSILIGGIVILSGLGYVVAGFRRWNRARRAQA